MEPQRPMEMMTMMQSLHDTVFAYLRQPTLKFHAMWNQNLIQTGSTASSAMFLLVVYDM